MAWTASLDVAVGDATKETDYDQLVANVEYVQTLADAQHNFHISTGTGAHTTASFDAGLVATPSVTRTGDLNTGMWYPGADTIAWSTGGTEAMRIDSAQKIYNRQDNTGYYTGIGDDTRLYFNATNAVLATAGALIFQTNGTTEAMRIDSSQIVLASTGMVVGSSTLSPGTGHDLTVVDHGSQSQTVLSIEGYNDQAGFTPILKIQKSHNDTEGTPTETPNGTTIGRVDFNGVNTSSAFGQGARIYVIQDDDAGLSYVPAYIKFTTCSASAVNDDHLVLDSSGNVGIGTAAPDGTLHVHTATAGTVAAPAHANELVIENSTHAGISILTPAASSGYINFGCHGDNDKAAIEYSHYSDSMRFYTNTVERIRIDSAGLVGINETANTNMTQGLTINQGTNDDEILALKENGIVHGITSLVDNGVFGRFGKTGAATGGLRIDGISVGAGTTAFYLRAISNGAATSTKSTSGGGMFYFQPLVKDGGTDTTFIAGDSNCVVISGASGQTKFIFDSDGDSHQDVGTAWTNMDNEPDALICRSAGIVMDQSSIVKSKFDDWNRDHKEDLIRTGLIPRLSATEEANGDRPLMNTTQLARLHNGAIWQTHVEVQEMREELDAKDTRILALEAQIDNIQRRLN